MSKIFKKIILLFFVVTIVPLSSCASDDFQYTEGLLIEKVYSSSGDLSVVGLGSSTDREIVIPPTYKGEDIKKIYYSAFYGCENITSIIISDGIESIDSLAFVGCTSLKYLYIPKSVTEIGDTVVDFCSEELIIYCESESIGEDWDYFWNISNYNVIWNC